MENFFKTPNYDLPIKGTNITLKSGHDYVLSFISKETNEKGFYSSCHVICKNPKQAQKKYEKAGYKLVSSYWYYELLFWVLNKRFEQKTIGGKQVAISMSNMFFHLEKSLKRNNLTLEL
jgi:hypothetical protein